MTSENFVFSDSVKRAMAQRNPVATGMELLEMGAGFRALWVNESKEPYPVLTPHGVKDATNDPLVLKEWSWYMPDSNLGIVWPAGLACIDRDDTSVVLDGIPPGTWAEKTRRGEHHLVTVPPSVTRKRRLPNGAGDFLAGPTAYTVLAPSPDRWPFDLDAPILPLDPQSLIGRAVMGRSLNDTQKTVTARVGARAIKKVPESAIKALVKNLEQGAYGSTITLTLEGRPAERYHSRSDADFDLIFMATHFTREANVLAALLAKFSRKARDASNPYDYISRTVLKALAKREQKDTERLEHLQEFLTAGVGIYGDVFDVTPRHGLPELSNALMKFAAISTADDYSREDGWRRVPVEDLAKLYEVHRQTVWRRLCGLEEQGRIERDTLTTRSDKGVRKDSLIRLVQ